MRQEVDVVTVELGLLLALEAHIRDHRLDRGVLADHRQEVALTRVEVRGRGHGVAVPHEPAEGDRLAMGVCELGQRGKSFPLHLGGARDEPRGGDTPVAQDQVAGEQRQQHAERIREGVADHGLGRDDVEVRCGDEAFERVERGGERRRVRQPAGEDAGRSRRGEADDPDAGGRDERRQQDGGQHQGVHGDSAAAHR